MHLSSKILLVLTGGLLVAGETLGYLSHQASVTTFVTLLLVNPDSTKAYVRR